MLFHDYQYLILEKKFCCSTIRSILIRILEVRHFIDGIADDSCDYIGFVVRFGIRHR